MFYYFSIFMEMGKEKFVPPSLHWVFQNLQSAPLDKSQLINSIHQSAKRRILAIQRLDVTKQEIVDAVEKLTAERKKEVRKHLGDNISFYRKGENFEYYMKIVIVAFGSLIFRLPILGTIGLIYVLPSYFSSLQKQRVANAIDNVLRKSIDEDERLQPE